MEIQVLTKLFNKETWDGRIITDELILIEDKEFPIKVAWDTGSTVGCISNSLAEKYGLVPTNKGTIKTTRGEVACFEYRISFVLNNDILIEKDLSTNPILDEEPDVDMLIGMDIISTGDFVISSDENQVCFSFRYPSFGIMDLNN